MGRKRRQITMTVTISVPDCFTPAEARKEVRSLVKDHNLYHGGKYDDRDNWIEFDVGQISVKPGKAA